MKAALCDDNKEILHTLDKGLRSINSREIKTELFDSGEALIEAYVSGKADFDVIFLDVEMGGIDGIETANKIRAVDKHVLIVFVTSYKKHMQRSFECQPFRFLVKPVSAADLQKVYREICVKLADTPTTFVFTENKQRIRLFCDDILFFESRGHWLIVHKKDGGTHKILKSIKELCQVMDNNRFCRIHRAFVVNLNFVYLVGNAELTLHGYDKSLPISRMYKKEFTGQFLNFEERKYLL